MRRAWAPRGAAVGEAWIARLARPAIAALLSMAALVVGAPLDAQRVTPGFERRAIEVNGTARDYLVRFPSKRGAAPRAIVVLLHGGGGSASQLLGGDGRAAPYRAWIPIADREGLVLVAPDALRGANDTPNWRDCRGDAGEIGDADDALLVDMLADSLAKQAALPRRLVFVVGTSNGGMLALRMAIERPERVTAVAAIAAAMPARSACRVPTRPVPVLFMNGTADKLMPWGGGTVAANLGGREGRGTVLGAEASAAVWARIAVAERPTTVQLPPAVESPLTTAARTSWRAHGRTAVVLVRITGGGHLEPSMVERYGGLATDFLGRQDASVEMADEVWRFFAEQIEP